MAHGGESTRGTEAPTAHRVGVARAEGRVAYSGALTGAVAITSCAAVTAAIAGTAFNRWMELTRSLWSGQTFARPRQAWVDGAAGAAALGAQTLAWTLGAAALGALAAGLIQTRGHFRWSAAAPRADRLLPATRRQPGREVLRGALTLGVGAGVLAGIALTLSPVLWRLTASSVSPGAILVLLAASSRRLMVPMLVVAVAVGLGDALWARQLLRRDLMMTKEDVRREARELEGDARWKGERRRRFLVDASASVGGAPAAFDRVDVDVDAVVFGVSTHGELRAAALRRTSTAGDSTAPKPPSATIVLVTKARGDSALDLLRRAHELGVPVIEDAQRTRAIMFIPDGAVIPDSVGQVIVAAASRRVS